MVHVVCIRSNKIEMKALSIRGMLLTSCFSNEGASVMYLKQYMHTHIFDLDAPLERDSPPAK